MIKTFSTPLERSKPLKRILPAHKTWGNLKIGFDFLKWSYIHKTYSLGYDIQFPNL